MGSSTTVNVSMIDTEIFKDLVQVLTCMIEDERLDSNVRKEYCEKYGYFLNPKELQKG